jgi:SpoVK/Ycf46/Vps4 family AAA+-type ATPase
VITSLLRDAAIAAAKTWSHEAVEPRHVMFAAARQFRSRPEVGSLIDAARNALEPRGTALGVPKVTDETEALLASFTNEQQVIDALLAFLRGRADPKGGGAAPAGAEQAAQAESRPAAATASPPATPPESIADVLADLDRLIGLAPVKRQLRSVIAVVQANQERIKAGMPPVSPGLHLVFTGPPGTGKTTVARLVARLYASTGALAGANFTEVGRADLVAGYVGQTALKTTEVIQRTRPGVLFIDEAYSLTPTHGSDFGAEAIATLVKAMEDYRSELAVIAAGYGTEMSEFIGSNPGLRSRFKTYIEFPNYGSDELVHIFEGFAKAAAIGLEGGVLEAAGRIFARAGLKPGFGNARFARSLFEQAYARMAARAVADGTLTVDELATIVVADLEYLESEPARDDKRIGFTQPGDEDAQ